MNLIPVAKMVLNDFLRGKIPWYVPDPSWPERKAKDKDEEFEGREGKLGEMRKRLAQNDTEDEDSVTDTQSWDGLDVETDNDGDEALGDSDMENGDAGSTSEGNVSEDERIEDPRPSKRARY